MSKVTPITCSLLAGVLAAWPMATAQGQDTTYSPWRTRGMPSPETPTQARTVGSALDTSYIRAAMRSNLTEVSLGRLANDRASSSEVKDFANRMVTDHKSMYQPWGQLASSYKMPMSNISVDLGEAGKAALDRLGQLKGTEFDQAYMSEMIQDHEQDLAQLNQMRNSAQDPQIRQLAGTGYSTVSQHLSLARQIGSRVGVATTAGRIGGVTYPTTSNPAPTTGTYRRPTTTATNPAATERNGNVNDNRNGNPRPLSAEDRRFVDDVLGDHQLHVRLATIALREAKRSETRELAKRVQTELMQWGNRWQGFADRHDANVSSSLERQDRNKIQRLRDAKEKNFDQAYAHIVANHMERMLENFRNERWDERLDPAGRLAQRELPVLRDLHERASQLERKLDNANDRSSKK
jgi:putative membrane protein